MASPRSEKNGSPAAAQRPGVWGDLKDILLAVALFLILRTSVIAAYHVPSGSMEDTLLVGDYLLCNQFIYGARIPLTDWRLPAIHAPERGDVVVFYYPKDPNTRYIKRCVAVGGDTVILRNKQLFVNGEMVPLPEEGKYIDTGAGGAPRVATPRDNYGPETVPQGHFFMMGDNRDNSSDSRFWGTVPYELVVGEAMIIHWSWDNQAVPSPEVTLGDPLSVPRLFLHEAVHFFEKVRFKRLLRVIS